MPKAVGIDLGLTNSMVAVMEGDEPFVIANKEGDRSTPSVVAFEADGNLLVGRVAKNQAAVNPNRTVVSVRRRMGTEWTINVDGKDYRPQEISARVLRKLKQDAEAYLGDTVTEAVITVPAYFNDAQRTATMEAGQVAGLSVLRIINEPAATALAYGLNKEHDDETILVFDLDHGTLDVSVLDFSEGMFQVRSTSGDFQLGGDDWDDAVVDWLIESFRNDHGVDLGNDAETRFRLKEASEQAKKELSARHSARIHVPFITATSDGPLHLDYELTRTQFEDLTLDLLNRCRDPFKQAIDGAGITTADVDHVILVGAFTRMPAVQELVLDLIAARLFVDLEPDEVVARGAAIQAGVLKGDVTGIVLIDVTPLTLGVETGTGEMRPLIKLNTPTPVTRTRTITTEVDNQRSIEIHALLGERRMAAGNRSLARVVLNGIQPAPRGVPRIEVAFHIDADGSLHVSLTDRATRKSRSVTVTGLASLSKHEINRIIADAEAHAEADAALLTNG